MITLFRRIRQKLIDSGSITKYLLYAIGEILLVVVGILIALQVNNWNEQQKEQRIAMDVRSSIIEDLTSDIESIHSLRNNIQNEIEIYDSLQLRLIDPEATEDEIIRLIRNEYSPFHYDFEGFNDNSYRTALSSGYINFLSDLERTLLHRLYAMQNDVVRTYEKYEQFYLSAIMEFNASYPLQINFVTFKSGPVYDLHWVDPDFKDLTSRFNNVGTSKRNYYRIFLSALNEINDLNIQTVESLEGNL